MAVIPAIDLTTAQHRTVLTLLNSHLSNTTVWAHGSRVKWTSHPASDLDLVAFTEPEQAARVAELREAFDESNLPFHVDLFVWNDVPESFRKRIEAEHVALAKREGSHRTASNEWPTVTLGACASLVADTVAPADSGDLPYIGLEHIGQGTLSLNGTGSARDVESTKAAFCAGDILFGKLRPYFRKVVRPRFDGICSTDIWVFRPKEDVDACFLYYLLASSEFVRFANQGAEGTRMPRAKWEQASQFSALLPPVSEQRAIALILGALDDKIELNRRMSRTLESTIRTLFKSWFTISEDHNSGQDFAKMVSLAEYAWVNPESWSAINKPDSVAYVDLSNTKWGRMEKVETYDWHDAPSRARRILRPGDTIVGTVRPGNGSFALVGKDGLTASTGFAVLRPKVDFDAQFVWCAATSRDNIERLARLADGGAYPAVSSGTIAATSVVLADIATRREFADVTAPLVANYLASGEESRALAQMRDVLLSKLIFGEIRISDAEEVLEAAV